MICYFYNLNLNYGLTWFPIKATRRSSIASRRCSSSWGSSSWVWGHSWGGISIACQSYGVKESQRLGRSSWRTINIWLQCFEKKKENTFQNIIKCSTISWSVTKKSWKVWLYCLTWSCIMDQIKNIVKFINVRWF